MARAILRRPAAGRYCTFADTDAAPLIVNVQLVVRLPPLEQAPDQIALRPFDTVRRMDVPTANEPDPLLPVATLMPVGVEVTRSPLRPLAVTVNVADCGGGGGGGGDDPAVTASAAVLVTPFSVAESVAPVSALTAAVVMVKTALCEPDGTVTLAGTDATPGFALDRATGTSVVAAAIRTTPPCALEPPVTLVGLTKKLVSVAPAVGELGVTVRVAVRVVPYVAVIVTAVFADTADVAIVNVAVKLFDAAVAVAGTLATDG